MPEAGPVGCPRGPRREVALPGESPATVISPVALAAMLRDDAQVRPQGAALLLVRPDVAVDGFVADREQAEARTPADHLLGTPIFPQQGFDERPVRGAELAVAPRNPTAPVRVALRLEGPVGPTIDAPDVPAYLPADGAAMPTHFAGDGS